MAIFDLVMLRIILTGLLTGLLLAIFLLIRWFLPNFWSGTMRRWAWIALLLMSLLIIPLPSVVKIPASAPEWLFQLRMPDPERVVINNDFIFEFFDDLIPDDPGSVTQLGNTLSENNVFLELTTSDRIILMLPYLRIVYFAGLLLISGINLILWLARNRRRWKIQRDGLSPERESWQTEIALLRDRYGYYRHADVILAGPDEDRPAAIIQNWFSHVIPVPTVKPGDFSEDRNQWLQRMLERNERPRLLVLVLWAIVRYLIWFIPIWPLCGKLLVKDFNRTQYSDKTKILFSKQLITGFVTSLLFLCFLVIILWQLPRNLLPVYPVSAKSETDEIEVIVIDSSTSVNQEFPNIQTERRLREVRPGNAIEKLQCIDAFGLVFWEKTADELFEPGEDGSIEYSIIETMMLDDQSWSILYQESKSDFTLMMHWRIILDQEGNITKRDLIASSNLMDSEDSHVGVVLMSDGGWILTEYIYSGSQFDFFSLSRSSVEYMARFDKHGMEQWRIDKNSKLLNNSAYFTIAFTRFNSNGFADILNNYGQLLPTENNNCILIMQDRSIFAHIDPVSLKDQVIKSNKHAMRVISLGQDGKILWKCDMPEVFSNFEYETSCFKDGILYLCAADNAYGENGYFSTRSTICAVSEDGRLMWQIYLDQFPNYGISDIRIENDCLTLLLNGFGTSERLQWAICQLGLDGQLIGKAAVDFAIGYAELLAAKPGTAWIAKPDDLMGGK